MAADEGARVRQGRKSQHLLVLRAGRSGKFVRTGFSLATIATEFLVIHNGDDMPTLTLNGSTHHLPEDPRVTLLDMIRLEVGLTGTKKGCDHGQCGACTVLLDGRRVNACLVLACQCEDMSVTTVEGLAKDGELHPLQQAFVRHDGFQCGYCTPGQLCSAVAMLDEVERQEPSVVTGKDGAVQWSREEITERMSGNLCRCGAYPNIVAAIDEVVGR